MILDKLTGYFDMGALFNKISTGVLLLIVGALVVWWWYTSNKKKEFNIDVGIHKTIGDSEIYLSAVAKQLQDDKGIIRFESKTYNIDLPAIESEFFGMSAKGPNRRYIDMWNPQAGIFLPMARDYLRMYNKRFKKSEEVECNFCQFLKTATVKKFKGKEWVKYLEEKDDIKVCTTHLNKYFQAKFKVVSEVPKQFMYLRMKERLLRAITHVPWYNQPIFQTAILVAGVLGFFVLALKFGPQWFEVAMEESAKQAGDTYIRTVNAGGNAIPPIEPPPR